MKCPYCGSNETKVTDKRETENIEVTRRRRECLDCEKRFTTYERIELVELTVVKKDGRREQFDRSKLLSGILRACEKRPVARQRVEDIVSDVEGELRNKDSTEVSSKEIGELVMTRLEKLDTVAYIRFASVYREFADVESFERAARELKRNETNGRKKIKAAV